jgi:hypothetical protein
MFYEKIFEKKYFTKKQSFVKKGFKNCENVFWKKFDYSEKVIKKLWVKSWVAKRSVV